MRKYTYAIIVMIWLLTVASPTLGVDVTLRWAANIDPVDGYYIHYNPDTCCDYAFEIQVPLADLDNPPDPAFPEYTIQNLNANTAYYFVVQAYKGIERSGFSNEVKIKAPQITSQPLDTYISDTAAIIEWTTNEPGNSEVQYGFNFADWGAFSDTKISAGNVKSHSISLSGLLSDTTYHYRGGSTNTLGIGPDFEDNDTNPSIDLVFRTDPPDEPDITAPQFIVQPYVISISDTTATIRWETDEPANSLVEFGLSIAYGQTEILLTTYTTNHAIDLEGLESDSLYHVRVTSSDQSGNTLISSDFTFQTDVTPDTTAPIFTAPPTVSNISDSTVSIEWTTNEPSSSKVRYGKVSANWRTYPSREEDFTRVSNHYIVVTGLEAETTYFWRAASADASSNQTISSEFTFTTAMAPDITPPEITSTPTVIAKTDTTATIVWNTNEPANSVVRYWENSWPGPRTWDNYQYTKNSSGLTSQHNVTLTNLTGLSRYYFMVGSSDAEGNGPTTSFEVSFVTEETPDTEAPQIISPPTVTAKTNQTITIEWVTDEPSNSLVQFGETSESWNMYPRSHFDPQGVTQHRVVIAGLDAEVLYYFRVGGTDAYNNGPDTDPEDSNPSAELIVVTEPDPDISAPRITAPPTVTAKTDTVAIIEWSTDEPSTSIVRFDVATDEWDQYTQIESNTDMVVEHSIVLTNLSPDQIYYFRVGSVDEHGNGPDSSPDDINPSTEGFFTTESDVDLTAPRITLPPTITGITDTTATVEWETDEPSNSAVKYTTSELTGDPKDLWLIPLSIATSNSMVTRHSVTLTNLDVDTRYYYLVGSTNATGWGPDAWGPGDQDPDMQPNNPFTQDFFRTEIAQDKQAPKIISGPTVTAKDNQSAIIEWETDEPSNSIVRFDTTAHSWFELTYGSPDTGLEECVIDIDEQDEEICYPVDEEGNPLEEGPYRSESDSEMVTHHSVTITGLQPSTAYYFRVGSSDALGNGPDLNQDATNPSELVDFTTEAGPDELAPFIFDLDTDDVAFKTNTTALITWKTDEPSNSMVQYGLASSIWDSYTFQESDAGMVQNHSITITGLQPSTVYYFRVGSTDAVGNGPWLNSRSGNPSNQVSFQSATGPDITAPQISNLVITTTSDQTALVEWITDEPSNSQVHYDTKTGVWQDYQFGESDAEMVAQHSVTITGLSPSTPYYLRVSSTDASGNNWATSATDTNPSIERLLTTSDAKPPAIVTYPDPDYPKVDAVNNFIEITYDEPNMQNARLESNYLFVPGLTFANPGNSIREVATTEERSTYRFSFDNVPAYTAFTLTVGEEITDTDGYGVEPATILINDNDSDGLPDDWEADVGLDPTSGDVDSGQGKEGDFDEDGFSNYEEFINNTDPLDESSKPSPPAIQDSVPHHRAGIDDNYLVPNNSSFGVFVSDTAGIDTTDSRSVVITVDDQFNPIYEVDAGDTSVVRFIKMDNTEPDPEVTAFWVVYDRFLDIYGSYLFNENVDIQVTVTNINAYKKTGDYRFRIETETEHNNASTDPTLPDYSPLDASDPDLTDDTHTYNAGYQIDSGIMQGTKIIFNDSEPVLPEFAPTDGIPNFLDSGLVNGIGGMVNVQPSTIFNTPVKLVIPTQGENASRIQIYIYNGIWSLASDTDGDIEIPGWMVPDSREDGLEIIQLKVRHFSGVHAAVVSTGGGSGGGGGGDDVDSPEDVGSCLINSLESSGVGQLIGLILLVGVLIIGGVIILYMRRIKYF